MARIAGWLTLAVSLEWSPASVSTHTFCNAPSQGQTWLKTTTASKWWTQRGTVTWHATSLWVSSENWLLFFVYGPLFSYTIVIFHLWRIRTKGEMCYRFKVFLHNLHKFMHGNRGQALPFLPAHWRRRTRSHLISNLLWISVLSISVCQDSSSHYGKNS